SADLSALTIMRPPHTSPKRQRGECGGARGDGILLMRRTGISLLALRACVAIALGGLLSAAAHAAPPEALLVGGKTRAGTLIAVEQAAARFATPAGEQTVPLKQLVRWGHPVEVR